MESHLPGTIVWSHHAKEMVIHVRTIELSSLNKHCKREVHATRAPFELAKAVPARIRRTVTDGSNEFHSVLSVHRSLGTLSL